MVKVYYAKIGDFLDGDPCVTPHKGTIAWASRLRGMIIPDTAEDVAMSQIDEQGRYICPISAPPTNVPAAADAVNVNATLGSG